MKINWLRINVKIIIIYLTDSILEGNRGCLTHLSMYLKIGETCLDCEEYFINCKCGTISEIYSSLKKYNSAVNEIDNIKKIAINLANKNLSIENLEKLINKLIKQRDNLKSKFAQLEFDRNMKALLK